MSQIARRVAVGGTRRGLPLGRLTLRVNFPAVLDLGVASPNSLRSLRSLRSDSRDESDDEAREYARRPQALRSSAPHRSPTPGTAHREAILQAANPASRIGVQMNKKPQPHHAFAAPNSARRHTVSRKQPKEPPAYRAQV